MAKKVTTKKTNTNKVAYPAVTDLGISKEMYDWLLEHGLKDGENITFHNPLLIQCVEELKPAGWLIKEIKGTKYRLIDTKGPFLWTPEDVKFLNSHWVDVTDQEAPQEEPKA